VEVENLNTAKALWVSTPPQHAGEERHQHNHRLKIERLRTAGKLPVARGKLNMVDVFHDGCCGILSGGFCDCDPDIRVNGRTIS
jgi:hypothetical protein